ncbi:hypothetical protein [Ferruginibacter sp.]
MRLFSIILVIAFILQSCLSASREITKKSTSTHGDMPILPYLALEKNKLDTTFDYEVLQKNIYLKLPDSILKGKIKGGVEFYVLIDQNKVIRGIELIECALYNNKKSAGYKFPDLLKEQRQKVQQFLLKCIPIINFKQTKEPTIGIHKTYCFANLYK